MRAALWLLALFGIAAAIALFAGNNQSTVTVYWPPWRVDFSLNLVLLLLLGAFVVLHTASRGLAALFDLPQQARRWRTQQKERAMNTALLESLSHLLSGRFIRARKLAQAALDQADALAGVMGAPDTDQLRALAHLLAAESAQSLQDPAARDVHLEQAQALGDTRISQETREAILLSAARWSLLQRDAAGALDWLDKLPQGAQRRTLALRTKLKAARLARRTRPALETARLLAKHRAFSPGAAQSIVRGLAIDLLNGAFDVSQLQEAWGRLESAERLMPEVAFRASARLIALGGDAAQARQWLLPVWERLFVTGDDDATDGQRIQLIRALEAGFAASDDVLDAAWLARIEAALLRSPRDPGLLYLAGNACLQQQLWGKAQQLLTQAVAALDDADLLRSAWKSLARLAEQRGDQKAAETAWRKAAGAD